eukprot:4115768-Pyramimonas_sp.AAC.1
MISKHLSYSAKLWEDDGTSLRVLQRSSKSVSGKARRVIPARWGASWQKPLRKFCIVLLGLKSISRNSNSFELYIFLVFDLTPARHLNLRSIGCCRFSVLNLSCRRATELAGTPDRSRIVRL